MGRDKQLEELHQKLLQGELVGIFAIAGMGGIGKTELALQYALRYQSHYPGGLCWLDCRLGDIATQIVSYGRSQLGLKIPEGIDIKSQISYCWRNWQQGKVLIVLDNLNDYGEVKEYLPPANKKFKILLTSRQNIGTNCEYIDLNVLDEDSSLDLLCSLVGDRQTIDHDLETARDLCKWLGNLPLGLELVGRYLRQHPTFSISKVIERLEKRKLEAKALCNTSPDMTAELGVAAAFELSWEELSEHAQKLGCFLSLFANAPFTWELVEQCLPDWDEEDLEDLRDENLYDSHLLQLTEQNEYQLHPLIREFFQVKLAEVSEVEKYKQSFCSVIIESTKQIPETPTLKDIAIYSPLIPHLTETANNLIDWIDKQDLIWCFVSLYRFYSGQGIYRLAEDWTIVGQKLIESRLGIEQEDYATILNTLANSYLYQGKYTLAESLLLDTLELRRKLLGEKHLDYTRSLNDLAYLYHNQGKYKEAEPLFLQALELRKKILGEDHPLYTTSLNNLAGLYHNQGKYKEAEPLLLDTLELRKKILGEDHPLYTTSLNNLASLYQAQGRYKKAEPLFLQALELRKKILGEDHPDYATSLNNLASLYQDQEKYKEAKYFFLQALELRKKILGENHPDYATSLNNLASLYQDQEKYKEAEPLFLQALELTRKALGENHPNYAASLNNLASLYQAQRKYPEAESLFLQALELTRKALGEEHPDYALSSSNLASLYQAQGKYKEGERLYIKALEILEESLDINHPNIVTIRRNIKWLKRNKKKKKNKLNTINKLNS